MRRFRVTLELELDDRAPRAGEGRLKQSIPNALKYFELGKVTAIDVIEQQKVKP
jgi:hypothetical protein